MLRRLIIGVAILGTTVFAGLFIVSYASHGFVERVAREVIRHQVESKVGERIDALDSSFMMRQAERLNREYEAQIAEARQRLRDRFPQRVAEQIALMADLDCECRKKIEKALLGGLDWRIKDASQAQERLNALIRAQYMETAAQLTREFRIFTGSNALVFALLLLGAMIKRQADIQLVPAAVVLLTAAVLTASLYLFNQNWLHTVIFSDYVGYAYLAYLSLALAFLGDVICNRARVTARLLSELLNSIGSSLVVPIC